jgi:hypothetical protein
MRRCSGNIVEQCLGYGNLFAGAINVIVAGSSAMLLAMTVA